MSVWIHVKLRFTFVFSFSFFFIIHAQQLLGDSALFRHYSLLFVHCSLLFVQCSSEKKNILKIGPTILFTHLKIILLKYFQFQQK